LKEHLKASPYLRHL